MATDFNALVERAAKRSKGRNRQPYVLNVEGDDPIKIPYPDALASMEYERATSVWDQVRILSGPEFPRLVDLFRGKDIEVVQLMLTEIWAQWDGDAAEVPGGKGV